MKFNKNPQKTAINSEDDECITFIDWSKYNPIARKYLFKIFNESKCHPGIGRRMNRMGRRKGVSDFFLPYPCNGKHGLWVEMKKDESSKATKEQADWLREMSELGYGAKLANNAGEAVKAVEDYLRIGL